MARGRWDIITVLLLLLPLMLPMLHRLLCCLLRLSFLLVLLLLLQLWRSLWVLRLPCCLYAVPRLLPLLLLFWLLRALLPPLLLWLFLLHRRCRQQKVCLALARADKRAASGMAAKAPRAFKLLLSIYSAI